MAISDIFDLKVNNQVKQDTPLDTFELDEQPVVGASVTPDTPAAEEESYLDKAIKRTEDVVAGVDPFTQQIMQRQRQTSAAREAAQRAEQRQQMTQAGMDAAFQQQAFQQSEAQRDTARAQEIGELATSLGERQDAATRQLAELSELQADREITERQEMAYTYSTILADSDLTTMSKEDKDKLLEKGKELYGPEYNFDKLEADQYDAKLEKYSVEGANTLLSQFGPQSGNNAFVTVGEDEVLDISQFDESTRNSLNNWYDAYTGGEGELFTTNEDGTITISTVGEAWLTNKLTEVQTTEFEKSMNEALAELDVRYPDGGEEYERVKDYLENLSTAALVGFIPESSGGALDKVIMIDSNTGDVISFDEEKYDNAGKDDDIGFYGVKDGVLTTENGDEYKVDKDGNVTVNGEEYTGEDSSVIKKLISGKDTDGIDDFTAPDDVDEGASYIDDGKLMINSGGLAKPISVTNPQPEDIKAIINMSSEDISTYGYDKVISIFNNLDSGDFVFDTNTLDTIVKQFANATPDQMRSLAKSLNSAGAFDANAVAEAPYNGLSSGWHYDSTYGMYYLPNDLRAPQEQTRNNKYKSSAHVELPYGDVIMVNLINKKGQGGGEVTFSPAE